LPKLENTSENSLSQGTGPSEPVETSISQTIPEIEVIEPRELHVGEPPIEFRGTPEDKWESHYELPIGYGSTRLVLMVRDPYWIHAYWEIAEDISDIVTTELGPQGWSTSRRVLRVHDVTDIEFDGNNSHRCMDIDIGDVATNWYINVDRPNRSYCAELGLMGPDGRFVCLSRSVMEKAIEEKIFIGEKGLPGFQAPFDALFSLGKILETMARDSIRLSELVSMVPEFYISKRRRYRPPREPHVSGGMSLGS
jgi:hypothetical protein